MISRRCFLTLTGSFLLAPSFLQAAEEFPPLLDHILLGCSDLDACMAYVEGRTGVRAAFGGVHPGRGTRNALLSLGERHYLEIIAPDPQQVGVADTRNLQELVQPRLGGWAGHPGEMNEVPVYLGKAGVVF